MLYVLSVVKLSHDLFFKYIYRETCRYIFKNSVSGEISYEFPTATGTSPLSSCKCSICILLNCFFKCGCLLAAQQETIESMDENEEDDDDQESDEESGSNEDIDPNKVPITFYPKSCQLNSIFRHQLMCLKSP